MPKFFFRISQTSFIYTVSFALKSKRIPLFFTKILNTSSGWEKYCPISDKLADMFDRGTLFGSVDEAKEAIKTQIIKDGIALAHSRKRVKIIKELKKRKAVSVPPWK